MDNQCLHPAAHENPCHGQIWFLLRISNPRGVVQWLYNPMFLSTSILIESYRLMFIWRFAPFISWIARCLCILSISKTSPWGHAQGPLTLRPGEWSCCSMAAAEQQVGTAAERADAILALNEGKYPKTLYDVWFGNCFAHTNAFEHGIEGGLQQDMGQSVGLYPPVVDRHPLHGQNLALPH